MPPKRKKRFHGLYYHSSPPRVLPMNAQAQVETKKKSADDFSIRLSTIRIWMHEKDIGKLTRVLWAGQGNRLRQQASTNPKVKRFLAAVPYVMNSIKDVHQSVVDNSLETLQATMESNVPPTLITCKDSNGLNVIHKAAGLGHTMILEYLLGIWPDGANETDMTGKTALHWAASAKNNMRCYTLLTQAGCEEDALDYKMKTPLYYKQKHNEIERSFLTQVPEAPRVSQDIPVDWEALAGDDGDDKKKPEIIIPNGRRRSDILGNSVNLLTSRSEANSIENTSEPDLFQGDNINEEHPEPPPEESESIDDLDQPLENGHVTNSEVNISEFDPASPPKTPEETPKDEEVEHVEDQPEKLPEEENVGNALNDQNNNDEIAVNEAEHKDSDNNVENDGEEEMDVDDEAHKDSEKEEINEEVSKEIDQKVEDPENEDLKNQEIEDVEDKVKEESETQGDDEKDEVIDTNEKENNKEKTDVTDSIKDNNETHNNDDKPEEQMFDEEEKIKIESEEIPSFKEATKSSEKDADGQNDISMDKTEVEEITPEENKSEANDSEEKPLTEAIDNALQPEAQVKEQQSQELASPQTPLEKSETQLKEQQSQESASQQMPLEQSETQLKEQQSQELASQQTPLEQSSSDELQSENSQAERPQSIKSLTESSHSNDLYAQKLEENTNKIETKENNESKNEESSEKHKESDEEDDDDQDLEIKPIDTPHPYQQPQIDENENNPEFDDKMTSDSPSPSMAIEGFIRGDSEDNQVQSESAAHLDDEERYIEAIINSGDMEQLAALVLNGDGKKILNKKSSKPEIQAFLTNVPAYMDKISRVHEAARQGTLYQLQAALDRRKFAIAKDENSPCGASPLHVAVLFGHSDIVRYLAGRFPETTSAVDDDGRTALHYAATINDNGHFFNLLSHLGGNPKASDKLGNTAEFYMNDERAKDVLTYRQLLKRFGSEALEDEMLNDQGKAENYSQNAIFKTEQGKYLASSLGDPLIKGLTEIADKRPTDPVAYLAGFLQNFIKSRNNNNNNNNNNSIINRDNDTGDTDSTALANSDAEIIATPNHSNGLDSPTQTEEHFSSPESTPKREDRDEHGQSMLHFACARSHRRNGLLNLIEESQIDVTYRDELYRTARDVSLQANQPGNAKEIDRFVLSLAVVGDTKPFEHMAIAGYDHILDVVDDEGISISDVAESRGHDKLIEFFNDLRFLEESREELHQATRNGDFERIKEITSSRKGKWLIKAKNYYGRNAMHIAVLKEQEETVEYFVNTCPDALKIGDNLERTPLHYAMGTNSVESVSRVLIRKGAKRTTKDLKGRQPSYYFINKADILRLQEEEDEHR